MTDVDPRSAGVVPPAAGTVPPTAAREGAVVAPRSWWRRRWIFIAVVLLSLGGGTWNFLGSDMVRVWLVASTETGLSESWFGAVKLGAVRGDWRDQLWIESISGRVGGGWYALRTAPLRVSIELTSLPTRAPALTDLACERVELIGMPKPGWLAGVPVPPPGALTVDDMIRWRYRQLRIGRVSLVPHASGPVEIHLDELTLARPDRSGWQSLAVDVAVILYGQRIASCKIGGRFEQDRLAFEGRVVGRVLGASMATDLKFANQAGVPTVSGYLAPCRFDLARLWTWWGETVNASLAVPLDLDGACGADGSWLWAANAGWSTNLRGQLNPARLRIKTPMPLPTSLFAPDLLVASVAFALTSDGLALNGDGSSLFGLPLSVTGGFRFGQAGGRVWNLSAGLAGFAIEKLWGGLPWLVRRQLAIPEITGLATASVQVLGQDPPTLRVRLDLADGEWPAGGLLGMRWRGEMVRVLGGGDPVPGAPAWSGGLDFGWRAAALPETLAAIRCGPEALADLVRGETAIEGRLEPAVGGGVFMRANVTGSSRQVWLTGNYQYDVWTSAAWGAGRAADDTASAPMSLPTSGQGALSLGSVPPAGFVLPGM